MAHGGGGWGQKLRWAAWALATAMLTAGGVGAADPYHAPDVLVDVATANPVAAREQALARAPEAAARQLFDRLVLREHRGRLAPPDPATLQGLVRGIEVRDERVSPQRYTARIVVVFDPALMRGYFQAQGVAFADAASKPLLILPVHEAGGALTLWEPGNPWRAAWEKAISGAARGGLVPLLLPRGDLDDAAVINAAQAASGNRDRLRQIAQYYYLSEVMVVRATQTGDGGAGLTVSAVRYGAQPQPVDYGSRSVPPGGGEAETVMARAVQMTIGEIEEVWRQAAWIASKQRGEVTLRIPLTGLEQLTQVRRRLGEVAAILEQEILTLTRQEAVLRVRYSGAREQLRAALGEAKLSFQGTDDDWILALSDAGPGLDPAGREAPTR
jgi:Uncharacterized protein conserved in bacteria (DUF2066)